MIDVYSFQKDWKEYSISMVFQHFNSIHYTYVYVSSYLIICNMMDRENMCFDPCV